MKLLIDWSEISSAMRLGNMIAEMSGEKQLSFEEVKADITSNLPPALKGFRVEVGVKGITIAVNPDAISEFVDIYGELIKAVVPVVKALKTSGYEEKMEAWAKKWAEPIEKAA